MHFLTKALVVLASILAIAVATLTTAYALNADRIRAEYTDLRAQKEVAEGLSKSATAQAQDAMRLLAEQRSMTDERVDSIERQLRAADERVRELELELAESRQRQTFAEAQYGAGVGAVNAQASVIEDLRTENSRLRDAELDSRERQIELQFSNSDLRSEVDELRLARQTLEERLVETQRELDRARSGGAAGTATAGIDQEIPGEAIVGRVREVFFEEETDKVLVFFDLGANDSVLRDRRMYVIRNDRYVGSLRVTQVDANSSVSVVVSMNDGVDRVQVGDTVTSKLTF